MLEEADSDDKGRKSVMVDDQALKEDKNVDTVVVETFVSSPIAASRYFNFLPFFDSPFKPLLPLLISSLLCTTLISRENCSPISINI